MVVVSGSDEEPEEGNVLVPEVIQALYRQQKSIENDILTKYGQSWSDVCIKLPVRHSLDSLTDMLACELSPNRTGMSIRTMGVSAEQSPVSSGVVTFAKRTDLRDFSWALLPLPGRDCSSSAGSVFSLAALEFLGIKRRH